MTASRLVLMVTLTIGLFVAPLATQAQQPSKVPRICFLVIGSPAEPANPFLEAFREGLHDLGYMEGRNIAIEYRWAE